MLDPAMRTACPALLLLGLLPGCQTPDLSPAATRRPAASAAAAAPARATSPGPASAGADAWATVRRFGAPIPPGTALALADVLAAPDRYADQAVTVDRATVRRNCTRKGCWMEVAAGEGAAAPGCRVTFQDYGFFVPLDSAGASARVQGRLEVRTIPAREVTHLESEGATFPNRQPDGTAREIRMVATGVELTRGTPPG